MINHHVRVRNNCSFTFLKKFSRSLARKSGENRANACDQNPLTSNKICTEIDFAQIVPKRPAGNKWCVDS